MDYTPPRPMTKVHWPEVTAADLNPGDPALPPDTENTTFFRAEARQLSELKALWRAYGKECSFYNWLRLRDRCRKDLWFLGKVILRKDLTTWHRHPCYRLFVEKDFNGVYHLGYDLGDVHVAIGWQRRKREMLFLASRGSFKSTLDGLDCVQWLINCPDIRILILTGEYKLAVAFMSEIKGYFYRAPKAQASMFHRLFPEYILEGKEGTSNSPLECPARRHNQKEPSLWVNSMESSLSGWHCDIRKMDDVITDENSNNPDSRGKDGKLTYKIQGTANLVDEWDKNNPDKCRESRRAWRKANPDKDRSYIHRRRARITGVGGSYTAQQFLDLCNAYGNVCLCCHRTEAELNIIGLMLVPDHVIAIAKGGSNDISNIQPLCHGKGGCNNKKSTKHVDYRIPMFGMETQPTLSMAEKEKAL